MDYSTLLDWLNSGASPQTQSAYDSGAAPSALLGMYANPDAVLSSPAAQIALSTGGGGLQALQDMQRRIMTGAEGLTGEAKYAALRDIATKIRALTGGEVPSAGSSLVPNDLTQMRGIMDRIMEARRLRYKQD